MKTWQQNKKLVQLMIIFFGLLTIPMYVIQSNFFVNVKSSIISVLVKRCV